MPRLAEPVPTMYEPNTNRKRWAQTECEVLRETGVLDGAYDLIDRDILHKKGQKPAHRIAAILLRNWLIAICGSPFVQSQAPIVLNGPDSIENEPEPDLAVTARPANEYIESNPGASEIRLVAEVSDTSIRFDTVTKSRLYARAGIPEYWIVDLFNRQLIVNRAPDGDVFTEVTLYADGEMVCAMAKPNVYTRVGELLPPD